MNKFLWDHEDIVMPVFAVVLMLIGLLSLVGR
jgi:hypothetical protein